MKHTGLMKALEAIGITLQKSRLECLSMLMLGMVEARTVNLKAVTGMVQSWAKGASVYRRAQRFFADIELDGLLFTRLMVKLLAKERYVLCIDRTNWKLGCLNINILMIAAADDGLAIPLAFILLNKAGNSNTLERTTLLEQVLQVIKVEQIEVLLADREFIGQVWFKFLADQKITFAIRIRENSLADEWFRLSCFFNTLNVAESRSLHHRYNICGSKLAVAATRSQDGQLVIIVTNRRATWALKTYALRWQIESLFKALKSSGFKLEDTHLRDTDRLSTLVAIVSLARPATPDPTQSDAEAPTSPAWQTEQRHWETEHVLRSYFEEELHHPYDRPCGSNFELSERENDHGLMRRYRHHGCNERGACPFCAVAYGIGKGREQYSLMKACLDMRLIPPGKGDVLTWSLIPTLPKQVSEALGAMIDRGQTPPQLAKLRTRWKQQ